MLRLDQRVRVNKTGQVGFVSKIEGERIMVRIPSNTDWPYPSYVHTHEEHLTKISKAKHEELEEALF
jgi:hypothetical protein